MKTMISSASVYLVLYSVSFLHVTTAQDGLYPEGTENIIFLNKDNFDENVYNSDYYWIINFYAAWCGHCQNFAPKFSRFAKELTNGNWPKFTKIGVLACSDRINSPLCSKQEITGYPTVKVYEEKSAGESSGVVINIRNSTPKLNYSDYTPVDRLKIDTSLVILKHYNKRNTDKKYDIFNEIPGARLTQHLVPNECKRVSTLTTSVRLLSFLAILDNVCISYKHMLYNDTGSEFKYFDTRSASTFLLKNAESYKEVRKYLKEMYHNNQIEGTIPEEVLKNSKYTEPKPPTEKDLESAIRYSLFIEVLNQRLDKKKLRTLKLWIKTLKVLYIGPYHVVRYLNRISSLLKKQRYSSTKLIWLQILKNATTPDSYINEYDKDSMWESCKGTHPRYRGYPCSLWSLFHTLTVNRLNSPLIENKYNARRLANIISRYIRDFFGCTECSENFLKRAGSVINDEIRRDKLTDLILWLWKGHNGANAALKGTTTEDPNYAKIQYPSKEACPLCRSNNSEWKKNQVLKYLVDFYTTHIEDKECVYTKWSSCIVPKDNKCELGLSSRQLIINSTIEDSLKVMRYININVAKSKVRIIQNKQLARCLGRVKEQKRFCLSSECDTSKRNEQSANRIVPSYSNYGVVSKTTSTKKLICYPLTSKTPVLLCKPGTQAIGGWMLTRATCTSQKFIENPASSAIYVSRGRRERAARRRFRKRKGKATLEDINLCKSNATSTGRMSRRCRKILRAVTKIYVGIHVTESCAV